MHLLLKNLWWYFHNIIELLHWKLQTWASQPPSSLPLSSRSPPSCRHPLFQEPTKKCNIYFTIWYIWYDIIYKLLSSSLLPETDWKVQYHHEIRQFFKCLSLTGIDPIGFIIFSIIPAIFEFYALSEVQHRLEESITIHRMGNTNKLFANICK